MKKIYLLLLTIMPLLSVAQSNYKKGYVINLKGDTLKGFIDYKEWGSNPTYINFKPQNTDRAERLTIKAISYFSITGYETYVSKYVKISLAPVDMKSISTIIDTTFKSGTVFLKVLEKGNNVTLLFLRDQLKPRFYIEDDKTNVIDELVYQVHLTNEEHGSAVIDNNRFHSQLIALAQTYHKDSPEFTDQILQAKYYKDELIKIVAKINDKKAITNTQIINTLSPVRFFAGVGINSANIKFYGDDILAQNPVSKYTPGPKLSGGLDIFINPAIRKLLIRVDASVYQAKYNLAVNKGTISNIPANETLDINNITTSISPKVIYNIYNTDSFKTFLGVGLSVDINSYPTDVSNIALYINPYTSENYTQTNYPQLKKIIPSINLNFGVVVNKNIEINATYILPHVVTNDYAAYHGSITNYQAGLSYLFGEN